MNLRKMRGLRFPDEYVIKFFFKEGLDRQSGNVLELGCGNGNNLLLFHQFGWQVTGIDIDPQAINNALFNFKLVGATERYQFIKHDITKGLSHVVSQTYDVILFPNILSYISTESALLLMREVKTLMRKRAWVFVRTRSFKDYRYGRGVKVNSREFILEEEETGEKGMLNVFYSEYEIVDMLATYLNIDKSTLYVLSVDFQNIQKGFVISNSDIVIWGRSHE